VKPVLELAAECQCWPTWELRGGIYENVDPHALPVSPGLVSALCRWMEDWDSQYTLDDPRDALGGPALDLAAFRAEGRRLAGWLRDEVGERWDVLHEE